MASVCKDPGGCKRILFVAPDGIPQGSPLGKCSLKYAQEVLVRVEDLAAATAANLSLTHETAAWLAGIGDDLAAKLAAVGSDGRSTNFREGDAWSVPGGIPREAEGRQPADDLDDEERWRPNDCVLRRRSAVERNHPRPGR